MYYIVDWSLAWDIYAEIQDESRISASPMYIPRCNYWPQILLRVALSYLALPCLPCLPIFSHCSKTNLALTHVTSRLHVPRFTHGIRSLSTHAALSILLPDWDTNLNYGLRGSWLGYVRSYARPHGVMIKRKEQIITHYKKGRPGERATVINLRRIR
jgi:hypothetical protein